VSTTRIMALDILFLFYIFMVESISNFSTPFLNLIFLSYPRDIMMLFCPLTYTCKNCFCCCFFRCQVCYSSAAVHFSTDIYTAPLLRWSGDQSKRKREAFVEGLKAPQVSQGSLPSRRLLCVCTDLTRFCT